MQRVRRVIEPAGIRVQRVRLGAVGARCVAVSFSGTFRLAFCFNLFVRVLNCGLPVKFEIK